MVKVNANRSGVLANAKLKEFDQAIETDGCHVLSVNDHKTNHIHGVAKIILQPSSPCTVGYGCLLTVSEVNC